MEQTCRPESVVNIHIPFIAECSGWQHPRVSGHLICNGGVAPETHLAISRWNLNGLVERIGARAVHFKESPGQRILRTSAISGRTEARISPGAGPDWSSRVYNCIYQSFLVAN